MADQPGGIAAITLFVTDLAAAKAFYTNAFERPVHYEDEHSAVFGFGATMVNLLVETQAPELVAPAPVGRRGDGARFQLTVEVDDVDATVAGLTARGVELLNGPVDRPWGIRTAAFADPDGHVWEIAH